MEREGKRGEPLFKDIAMLLLQARENIQSGRDIFPPSDMLVGEDIDAKYIRERQERTEGGMEANEKIKDRVAMLIKKFQRLNYNMSVNEDEDVIDDMKVCRILFSLLSIILLPFHSFSLNFLCFELRPRIHSH